MCDFAQHMEPSFRPYKLHQKVCSALDWFLKECEAQRSPRLILEIPPQHGKSTLASKLFPARIFGEHPDWQMIHTSYTADLSNDMSRAVKDYLNSPAYESIYPEVKPSKTSRSVKRWAIENRRGTFFSVGAGGPITGRGANVIIIDDPVKNQTDADSELFRQRQRDWYQSTLRTRLRKGGGILLILTRWHEADLAGFVAEGKGSDRPPAEKWRRIKLPAIAESDSDVLGRKKGEALCPELFPIEELQVRKAGSDPRWWNSLYQQRPSAEEGNIIKVGMIKDFPRNEAGDSLLDTDQMTIYQAWDLAISEKTTADYTVCTTIGVDVNNNIYVLDVRRERIGAPEMVDALADQSLLYNPDAIGIETRSFQTAIMQFAVERYMLPFTELETDTDKVTRAQLFAQRVKAGKVFADKHAEWYDDWEEELKNFPNADKDDQVDSVAHATNLAKEIQIAAIAPTTYAMPDAIKQTPTKQKTAASPQLPTVAEMREQKRRMHTNDGLLIAPESEQREQKRQPERSLTRLC